MKTKKRLFTALLILSILLPATLFTGIFLWARQAEALRQYAALAALAGQITAQYPGVSPEALLAVLSGEGDPADGVAFLEKYGYTAADLPVLSSGWGGASLACVAGGALSSAGAALGVCLLGRRARDREIEALTSYLKEIAAGADALHPEENSEDALSKLKNEICKLTVLLRETAGENARQRQALSSSLADIAHQIKTPLTSALILLDNIADAPDMDEATRADFISDARAQLRRVSELCVALLRLSSFDAGTVRLRPERLTPRRLIEAALKNVSVLMDVRGVTAEVSGDLDAPFTADLYWQTEALANIIKNAVEHSEENGVVYITAQNAGLFVSVRVRDTGSGIGEADLPHIFERFYKAENAGPDSFGVGLALAKAVIERDGGSVKAVSAPGKGSTFTVAYSREKR